MLSASSLDFDRDFPPLRAHSPPKKQIFPSKFNPSNTPSPTSSSSTLAFDDDAVSSILQDEKLDTHNFQPLESSRNYGPISEIKFRPASQSSLDPHARPFFPPSAIEAPDHYSIPMEIPSLPDFSEDGLHPVAWLSAFVDGTQPDIDPPERAIYAHALVLSQQGWSDYDLQKLAYYFYRRGTAGILEKNDPVAPFVIAVYWHFSYMYGEDVARIFALHMYQRVYWMFKAGWSNEAWDSPPSELEVTSLLSLSKFVAELFVHDMFSRKDLAVCLSMVLWDPKSVEWLIAVRDIVVHAGVKFWQFGELDREQDITNFISEFHIKASRLATQYSSRLVAGCLANITKEVVKNISNWQQQLRTLDSLAAAGGIPVSEWR